MAALAEMYVQGVSTRKVKAITEELCGHSFRGKPCPPPLPENCSKKPASRLPRTRSPISAYMPICAVRILRCLPGAHRCFPTREPSPAPRALCSPMGRHCWNSTGSGCSNGTRQKGTVEDARNRGGGDAGPPSHIAEGRHGRNHSGEHRSAPQPLGSAAGLGSCLGPRLWAQFIRYRPRKAGTREKASCRAAGSVP